MLASTLETMEPLTTHELYRYTLHALVKGNLIVGVCFSDRMLNPINIQMGLKSKTSSIGTYQHTQVTPGILFTRSNVVEKPVVEYATCAIDKYPFHALKHKEYYLFLNADGDAMHGKKTGGASANTEHAKLALERNLVHKMYVIEGEQHDESAMTRIIDAYLACIEQIL